MRAGAAPGKGTRHTGVVRCAASFLLPGSRGAALPACPDYGWATAAQTGSPSPAAVMPGSGLVVFTPMPQVNGAGICVCVTVAVHEPAPVTIFTLDTLVEGRNFRTVSPRTPTGVYGAR